MTTFAASPHPPVVIIGAGPAGLSMACALADAGIDSLVLEQASLDTIAEPVEDGREIALTHHGIDVLRSLEAWQDLPPNVIYPLRGARVENGTGHGSLVFDSAGSGRDRLGSLVPNHWLRRVAYQGACRRTPRVTLRTDARVLGIDRQGPFAEVILQGEERIRAQLLIAADSRFSATRRMAGIGATMLDFGRTVIVCRMTHERPHDQTALEWFGYGHTMAWLPLSPGVSSLVLTLPSDRAQAMMNMDDSGFFDWVVRESRDTLGLTGLVSARHHYPLVATYAQRFAVPRLALVGDAAVGMHPVTAHGYNFGLYGIERLGRLLAGAHVRGTDLGHTSLLERYSREHRRATWGIYQGTNAVVRLFTDERAAARLARRGVLDLAERLPPLKAAITAQLTGRQPPFLARLIALAGG